MAVVWLFRIAIVVGPTLTRLVQSPQPSAGQQVLTIGRSLYDRLRDPDESDEDLSAALSEANGYPVNVASYTGTFELRKLHVIWSAVDAAVATDDSRICTFHLAKIASGVPTDAWVAGDFTTVTGAINTMWGSIKSLWPSSVVLDRMKFYKDGPGIDPPQVPVYDADFNVAGTVAITSAWPPQCAISVTEKAGSKRFWGRFFLPAPGEYGRRELRSTALDDLRHDRERRRHRLRDHEGSGDSTRGLPPRPTRSADRG